MRYGCFLPALYKQYVIHPRDLLGWVHAMQAPCTLQNPSGYQGRSVALTVLLLVYLLHCNRNRTVTRMVHPALLVSMLLHLRDKRRKRELQCTWCC